MCSKFGQTQEIAEIVKEVVTKNVANKTMIDPQVFDQIEDEIYIRVKEQNLETRLTGRGD